MADAVKVEVTKATDVLFIDKNGKLIKEGPGPKGTAEKKDTGKTGTSFEFDVVSGSPKIDTTGMKDITVDASKGATPKLVDVEYGKAKLKVSGAGEVKAEVLGTKLTLLGSGAVRLPKADVDRVIEVFPIQNLIAPTLGYNKNNKTVTVTSSVRISEAKDGSMVFEQEIGNKFVPLVTVAKGSKFEFVNVNGKPLLTIDGNKTLEENQKALSDIQDDVFKGKKGEIKSISEYIQNKINLDDKGQPIKKLNPAFQDLKFEFKKVPNREGKVGLNLTPDDVRGFRTAALTGATPEGTSLAAVTEGASENTGMPAGKPRSTVRDV